MMTDEERDYRREQRAAKQASKLKALHDEAEDLACKFEDEGKTAGVDFSVVTTSIGNFVIGKPDFLTAKRFNAKDTKAEEDVIQFITPSILHPDRAAMMGVFQEHGGIAWDIAAAALILYKADTSALGKK